MTTDYLDLRNHLEERLTQFDREMPGPTLAPRLRAGRVQVWLAGRALFTPRTRWTQ